LKLFGRNIWLVREILKNIEKIEKLGFYKSKKKTPENVGDKIKLEQNGHAKDTDKLQVRI
jgi:hypothetical protein